MVCTPTTTASTWEDGLYNRGNILKLGENILSFDELADLKKDPTSRFDRERLVETTFAINRTLNQIRFQEFDFTNLNARMNGENVDTEIVTGFTRGFITQEEVAGIIEYTGMTFDKFEFVVVDFDGYMSGLPEYPNYEIYPSTLSDDMYSLLYQMDTYYSNGLSGSMTSGICGFVSLLLSEAQRLDFIAKSIRSVTIDLTTKGLLDRLKDTVVDIVTRTVEEAVARVIETGKNIARAIERLANPSYRRRMAQEVTNSVEAYADDTINEFKSSLEGIVEELIAQFEDLNFETLSLLLYRLCQFANTVQNFMERPLENLQKIATALSYQRDLHRSRAQEQTQLAVEAGAVRLDDTSIESGRRSIAQSVNTQADSIIEDEPGTPVRYIPWNTLTREEEDWIMNPTHYLSNRILFSGLARKPGFGAPSESGYKRLTKPMLEMLIRIANRFGELFVDEAWLPVVPGFTKELQNTGNYIVIRTTTMTPDETKKLAVIASSQGIGGLGFNYSTQSLHMDLGPVRSWSESFGQKREDYLEEILYNHRLNSYVYGPQ